MPAPRRRLLRLTLALLLADLLAVLSYLAQVEDEVPVTPQHRNWPVGILFFADFDGDAGIGPESRDRVKHAAGLYRTGQVGHLLCVGGWRGGLERFGAERMADALTRLGIPSSDITADRSSFDTRTNWESAERMLRDGGWQEALLVSSALHLYRIGRLAPEGLDWTPSPSRSAFEALRAHPFATWLAVHREWIAWIADGLLPPDTHRDLIRRWRNFRDGVVAGQQPSAAR